MNRTCQDAWRCAWRGVREGGELGNGQRGCGQICVDRGVRTEWVCIRGRDLVAHGPGGDDERRAQRGCPRQRHPFPGLQLYAEAAAHDDLRGNDNWDFSCCRHGSITFLSTYSIYAILSTLSFLYYENLLYLDRLVQRRHKSSSTREDSGLFSTMCSNLCNLLLHLPRVGARHRRRLTRREQPCRPDVQRGRPQNA